MLRILGVLVILAAIAGIVAYKFEWVKFSQEDGKTKIEVDKDKAKHDLKEGVKELEEGAGKVKSEVMEAIKPTPKK